MSKHSDCFQPKGRGEKNALCGTRDVDEYYVLGYQLLLMAASLFVEHIIINESGHILIKLLFQVIYAVILI